MGEPSAKRTKTTDESPNFASDVSETVREKLMELDQVQYDLDDYGEKAAEEILQIEQKYNKLRQPHYLKRKNLIQHIPNFWQHAFLNHHLLSTAVPEEDEELLGKLKELEVEEFEDIKSGYKIKMTFEKNNFFDNETIVKTFHLNTENPNSVTTEIAWKPNKKPEIDKDASDTQVTFLQWLVTNLPPDSDEIAEVIKDDLYINPLQYYVMPDMESIHDDDLDDFEDEQEEEAAKE
ncbi:unnamed protein product [Caenorhabditis angaria]|uniref:Uncharacterized protein n=1 Tax=Caenorhabditis angaria TaxID=860376 RepID=A0A9P1IQX8_9PELO|nr:unnamed protein product [Caenorhabditis angaria]